MAIPPWRQQLPQSYIGARKWGTGVNAVHGRNTNPGRGTAPGDGYSGMSDLASYDFGYTPEDSVYADGYGVDLQFMQAHPNWGDPDSHARTGQFPDWGHNGIEYRSLKIGTNVKETEAWLLPNETVNEGWINKEHGDILDSRTADDSQLFIQTSDRQRNLSKDNDRAVQRGTDEARTPIATRLVGMKVKEYSGGKRHEDMTPVTQDAHPRPWLYRSTADGVPAGDQWLPANAWDQTTPLTREVPADVEQGPSATSITADDVWTEGW